MNDIKSDFEKFLNNFEIQEAETTFLINYFTEIPYMLEIKHTLLLFLCYFFFIKSSILLCVDALIYNDLDTVSFNTFFYGFYYIIFRLLLLFLIIIIYSFFKEYECK